MRFRGSAKAEALAATFKDYRDDFVGQQTRMSASAIILDRVNLKGEYFSCLIYYFLF